MLRNLGINKKTHELETGNNGKAHTRKRGTRSENKENVNNADWRELKSYTSHEVRIFLTANLSGIVLSSSVSLQK